LRFKRIMRLRDEVDDIGYRRNQHLERALFPNRR
jgi:hypothetical protein